MSDLLKLVKARLTNEICTEHREKATITISGDNLSFKCCCESFREKIIKKMKVETEKATVELISKLFKK